jgi:23S rRNA (uridine2552-2'-O)-methyltransferase
MHADSWAIKAKQLGLRSRAVFKLEEILQKTKVLKRGSNIVLDIGSAPGGWSELIKSLSLADGPNRGGKFFSGGHCQY